MWPFDEELTPASRVAYPFSGTKARQFAALIELYSKHYYPLPQDGEETLLPERAREHVMLALARLGAVEMDPAKLLRALEETKGEVYGPEEIEELRGVLQNQHNAEANEEGAREPGAQNPEGPTPEPPGDDAIKKVAPPEPRANGNAPTVSVISEPSPSGFVSPRRRRESAAPEGGARAERKEESVAPPADPAKKNAGAPPAEARSKRSPAKNTEAPKRPPQPQPDMGTSRRHAPIPPAPFAEGLVQRIEALEAKVAGMHSGMSRTPTPGNMAPAIEQRLAAIEQAVKQGAQAGQAVERLQRELAAQRQQITQLERRVAEAEKRAAQTPPTEKLRTGLEELKLGVEALETEQLELRQKLEEVQAWLETLKSVLATLTGQVTALEEVVGHSEPTPAPPRKLLDLLTRKKS
ncbi:hypothetical protein Ocepr_2337 (plasmid) [Oceanithermus profundus DSM 14977]|uniref:Uncharacterized protein n=1 Tax=Oceanithermus profundus (strain DSM 14977 / NBRC 100410 / VKM B-2274 / 506) TaxID=670487 RepID=E4UAK6_OCEP5|nr:hypothetical protein [Oceanithermus profundus]ADR37785.1 hypothetical protein Ocepr_2337 [Oceanithermus profundus DSM 14977]